MRLSFGDKREKIRLLCLLLLGILWFVLYLLEVKMIFHLIAVLGVCAYFASFILLPPKKHRHHLGKSGDDEKKACGMEIR